MMIKNILYLMINVRTYSHQAKAKKIKEQAVVFDLKLKNDIFDRNESQFINQNGYIR